VRPILCWGTAKADRRLEQTRRTRVRQRRARHDAAAFFLSGIAERLADHLTAGHQP
jgi:hypothetical protein